MTAALITAPNLSDPDALLRRLSSRPTRGWRDAASELLNVRLVLILANHIGDPVLLEEALALAKSSLPTPAWAATTTHKAD